MVNDGAVLEGSKVVTFTHGGTSDPPTYSSYAYTDGQEMGFFSGAYGDIMDSPFGVSGGGNPGVPSRLTLPPLSGGLPAAGTGRLSSQASWLTSPSAVTPIELSADAQPWAAHFAVVTAAELAVELVHGGSAPALSWSTPTHGQTARAAAVPDRGLYEVQQEAAAQDPPPSSGSGETFNATGQITSITDAGGGVTKATYDAAQRLTSVTDPATASHPDGNTTTWTYNDQNRVTSQTTALGTSSFAYASPSCGNLTQYTDADGRVTTYQYDWQNRVTQEAWYSSATDANANNGAGQNAQDVIHYGYDPSTGNLTAEWDATSADYYTYNDAGQLATVVETVAGGPAVELVYAYYDSGECSGVAASIGGTVDASGNYSGGTLDYQNAYTYDDNGDLTQIVQSSQSNGDAVATKEIDFTYTSAGQFDTITRYENGQLVAQSDYTYNSAGQLIGLEYQQGSTNPLASYVYTYGTGTVLASAVQPVVPSVWLPSGATLPFHDPSQIDLGSLDQAPSSADLLATVTSADGTTSYSYDALGELTSASGAVNESYTWDANGNPSGSGYSIGPENEILSDGTYIYTYNLDGDMLKRTQISSGSSSDYETDYTWDNRNRLTEVTNKDNSGTTTQTVTYLYDVENRWIGETVTTYSGGSPSSVHTTDFAYDGNQIVLQFDKDGAGNVTANDLSHRYLYGPAVDQVLADERVTLQNAALATDEVLWPLADAQGTVRDVAKLNGTTTSVKDHIIYGSFGGVVSESDSSQGCLFKYTGCATDNNTDIEFHERRVKPAGSTDWLSVDPIRETSGTTNLSDYCGNDPINATDPSGTTIRVAVGTAPKINPIVEPEAGEESPTLQGIKWFLDQIIHVLEKDAPEVTIQYAPLRSTIQADGTTVYQPVTLTAVVNSAYSTQEEFTAAARQFSAGTRLVYDLLTSKTTITIAYIKGENAHHIWAIARGGIANPTIEWNPGWMGPRVRPADWPLSDAHEVLNHELVHAWGYTMFRTRNRNAYPDLLGTRNDGLPMAELYAVQGANQLWLEHTRVPPGYRAPRSRYTVRGGGAIPIVPAVAPHFPPLTDDEIAQMYSALTSGGWGNYARLLFLVRAIWSPIESLMKAKRRFQYTLRTLFGLTTLFCIAMSLFATKWCAAQRQE